MSSTGFGEASDKPKGGLMLERRTNWQSAACWRWRLEHDGHEFQCVIGLEQHGFQARFLFNGKLLSEYMFGSWAEASSFAGQRRSDFESKGYRESQMKRRHLLAS
jgi:hypothetical protein